MKLKKQREKTAITTIMDKNSTYKRGKTASCFRDYYQNLYTPEVVGLDTGS